MTSAAAPLPCHVIDHAVDRAGLLAIDDAVYERMSHYCFDEAVCWPGQVLLAQDLGVSQPTISRSVQRLRRAGWLTIAKKRGRRWFHNVYELLEPFKPFWHGVADRIVARSKRRVNTNFEGRNKRRAESSNARAQAPPAAPNVGASGADPPADHPHPPRPWVVRGPATVDRSVATARQPGTLRALASETPQRCETCGVGGEIQRSQRLGGAHVCRACHFDTPTPTAQQRQG